MNEIENEINYDEILNIVRNQMVDVMNKKVEYYKGYDLKITRELQFIKTAFKDNPKCICMVLKFGATSINFAQSVVTCSIIALSEANQQKVAQQLLNDYSQAYNLVRMSDDTIQQLYDSPSTIQSFEYETFGIKSIISCEGVFIISKTANFFDLYNIGISKLRCNEHGENQYIKVNDIYKFLENVGYTGDDDIEYRISTGAGNEYYVYRGDNPIFHGNITGEELGIQIVNASGEEIPLAVGMFITISTMFENTLDQNVMGDFNLDSQPMYNHNNFSSSVGKYGTLTFTVVSYLMFNSLLQNQGLAMTLKSDHSNFDSSNRLFDTAKIVNHTFALKVVFRSGANLIDRFKLLNFRTPQQKGQLPSVSMTFTN